MAIITQIEDVKELPPTGHYIMGAGDPAEFVTKIETAFGVTTFRVYSLLSANGGRCNYAQVVQPKSEMDAELQLVLLEEKP
jgi:hypothetical protein